MRTFSHDSHHYGAKHYIQETARNLRERGVVAMEPNTFAKSESNHLFVFGIKEADKTRVGNVIKVTSDGSVETLEVGFTRHDMSLNDNFDAQPGRTIPVENVTFGACKLLIQKYEINRFLYSAPLKNPPQTDDDLLVEPNRNTPGPDITGNTFMNVASNDDKPLLIELLIDLRAALQDQNHDSLRRHHHARKVFIARLLWPLMDMMDKMVFTWAKRKQLTISDPVVALCTHRQNILQDEISAVKQNPEAIINLYFRYRDEVLPMLHSSSPYICKLAMGRAVLFASIKVPWEDWDIASWVVYFARRFFLATNPDLAYIFCLLHMHGPHWEISNDDEIWACKLPSIKDKAGPLDQFESGYEELTSPEYFTDIWTKIENSMMARCGISTTQFLGMSKEQRKPYTPKLGRVNGLVAHSLLNIPLTTAQQLLCVKAQDYLTHIGWLRYFQAYVAPNCHGSEKFHGNPFSSNLHLDHGRIQVIRNSTMSDVVHQLDYLKSLLQDIKHTEWPHDSSMHHPEYTLGRSFSHQL